NFAADSKSNAFLKTMKPGALAGLKSMPADYTTFTAFDFGAEAYQVFHPIVKALSASGGEEDDEKGPNKAISDALDEMLAAKPRKYLSASKRDGHEELQVWDFADPKKGVAAQLKLFRALKEGAEYQMMPLKDKPVIKANSAKYRNSSFHYVRLKWDLDKVF